MRLPLASVLIAFLTLTVFASASPTTARRAPERAPDWGRLEPRTTEQRLTLVEEMAGQFWTYGDELVHVLDLALVARPDGNVAILRAAFLKDDGTIREVRSNLEDHPEGTVEIHALDDVTPGSRGTLWWSDWRGEVLTMSLLPSAPSPVDVGGFVRVDRSGNCLLHFRGICIADTCPDWACTAVPPCECAERGRACTEIVGTSCNGTCSPGKSCARELLLGGCSCQN